MDRTEERAARFVLVSLAQAVVATGLVFADGLATILPLAALLGAGAAMARPGRGRARAGRRAREGALAKANGWIESARYAGYTAGPLIAGALGHRGRRHAGGARRQRRELRGGRGRGAGAARPACAGGWSRCRGPGRAFGITGCADRTLRVTVTAGDGSVCCSSRPSMTVEVFYVRDVVHAGPTG